ncbi:hypothetical protein NESM_000318300 [Novymonas esmeraldas]|uniref:SWIM-type domain-containing protein n=1 Tax=Novymonas esmeraldas TaxID=1808958 RepID=A0AAW0EK86_9TRYP
MEDFPLAAEVYPALVTSAVLDAYARFVVADAEASGRLRRCSDVVRGEALEVPESIEAALAPLEVLYGKTALSAIGIALHGAEPIIRYVERVDRDNAAGDEENTFPDKDSDEARARRGSPTLRGPSHDSPVSSPAPADSLSVSAEADEQHGRCLYHVGEHTLFSAYYCPCSAYAYQSIQRQEVWCCKHLLALQLALCVEATGVPQECLRVRVVEAAEYEQLLLSAL